MHAWGSIKLSSSGLVHSTQGCIKRLRVWLWSYARAHTTLPLVILQAVKPIALAKVMSISKMIAKVGQEGKMMTHTGHAQLLLLLLLLGR